MLPFWSLFVVILSPIQTESSLLDKKPSTAWDTLICDKDEVTCLDQRRCIPMARVCDNQQDCIDNSDELECENSCRGDAFRCNNGKCIPRKWTCDSFNDCGDNSDEIHHCLGIERLPCSQDAYRCEEGPCIPIGQVCDGKTNCPRGDDESRCPKEMAKDPSKETNSTPRENTIGETKRRSDWFFRPENQFKANSYSPFSSISSSSDRSYEPYGSLEQRTSPKKMDTPHYLMPSDHSDPLVSLTREPLHLVDPNESNLNSYTNSNNKNHQVNNQPYQENKLICADHEFKCTDGLRCIPIKSRCDQRFDCVDQSDEKHCSIDPCVFGLFRCHSGKCAISSWKCNATDWTGRRVTVLSKDFDAFL